MSRTLLWIMTIFLSLAMMALVAVQAYWIKHSIRSEEVQLGLLVSQVLTDVSDELVKNETVINIIEEVQPPVVQHQSRAFWNFQIDARSVLSGDSGHVMHMDEEFYVYSQPPVPLVNQKVELIDDSILVILGEDELMQDTILISAMKHEQLRSELEKEWMEQEVFVDRIVRRMMVEEEGIEDKISGSQVETLLKKKLAEKGVRMPFEYAVYHEGEKPIFQSESFNEYENYKYFRASLFPGSVFSKPTLISIYFPDEKQHLRKSMGLIGGSSLLITLLVLMLFSLALFIIFKQKRLSEMKNDFVNNMTHELKTPISTISLASQMLSDRSIPDEQKNLGQISRIIQAESKQLGYQVERVLQMAIFDDGQLKLKIQEVDLHDIIETVAQNFLLQLEKREGKLEFLPEAEETVISGDVMHLTNVISNLIENAMKYTRRTPEITIATKNMEGSIVVSVVDNGIGISKEDQKRIFDKFFRVPTGNVHNVKGFGLGLSYVKLIVEHHDGSIHTKSEPEMGSQFDIHLPLRKE
jgi:two-component system phosphate regulon sensor histidine kinase PhoR